MIATQEIVPDRRARIQLVDDESADGWQRADCDNRCHLEPVVLPGMRRGWLPSHSPAAHYERGFGDAMGVPTDYSRVHAFGKVRVDGLAYRAWVGEREIHLSPTEFKILMLLASRMGGIVRREEILRVAWGPEYAGLTASGALENAHLLRVNMSRLRARLDDRQVIGCVPAVGYRLNGLPDAPGGR